jgi:NAD+ synthase (glutamine-hydrolysing)
MPHTIAIAQLRPAKADYAANIARLGQAAAQAASLGAQVLVGAETATSGYFLEGGVRDLAVGAGQLAQDLQRAYHQAAGKHAPAIDIALGFYERYRDRFYNSALYASLGANGPHIRHVHRKVFLPTYGVFDEARFVEAGHHVAAFDTPYGRAALLICEDAWHNISGTLAALDGAQVVYVVSASPARGAHGPLPDNVAHWEDLCRRIADEHGVYVVLAQQVGFEGGKGFPGRSLLMDPRGRVLASAPLWDEALLAAPVDLDELALARADLPLLADLEQMLPHLEEELRRARRSEQANIGWEAPADNEQGTGDRGQGTTASVDSLPHSWPVHSAPAFRPEDTDAFLALDWPAVAAWLVAFLRDEVARRRGFSDVVVATSGGVDSALTAALCARAFGGDHVHAVRLPYRSSSRESLDHGQLVIDTFGLKGMTVDISEAVDGYARFDPEIDGRRKGNVMARTRMIALFDLSAKHNALPIGTGNKTERLFGYYTWHADDSPPINPLGDLFKTQVWQLARELGVPEVIVGKPASADLIVGQTDEADFGISYLRADRILFWLLQGYAPARLEAMGFDAAEVALVARKVKSTHWKRHLPSTAMLSGTAIGEYYLRPLDY